MSNDIETSEYTTVESTAGAPPPVVVERRVEVPVERQRSRVGPFLAGVIATVAVGAIGLAAFFAISDADDDGNLELDVPAVELDIQE